jgi:branched-chain amino acid transport system permease protein
MPVIEVILGGVILGGLYALVAMGFNLQYGVARIVNLAYGEFLMSAAFAAFWMFTLGGINPILGMALTVPATFGANWLIYRVLMTPLTRRARTRDQLEGETILATFGLLFVLRGAATLAFTPTTATTTISASRCTCWDLPSRPTACWPSPRPA